MTNLLLIFSIKLNLIFKLGYIFSNLDLELLCVDARILAPFSEAVLEEGNFFFLYLSFGYLWNENQSAH